MEIFPIAMAVIAAAVAAALSAPLAAKLAVVLDIIDRPSERKVNKRPEIPLLGGVAVAMGVLVGMSVLLVLHSEPDLMIRHPAGLFLGCLLILLLGIVDDRYGLGAWPKLAIQLIAAGVAFMSGYSIDHVTEPFTRTVLTLSPVVAWLATTAWIVIVTNSINLIDGLDGLCTGVSAIIAATLTVIAFQGGAMAGVGLGVILFGALLGFLPFNFPPARMFLGDTGALFIGYVLSILALEGYARVTLITFLVPLLALAVPLLDTVLSIFRRLRTRAHIMQADKMHLHHRLLEEYEGSQQRAVLSIYFLTGCFCLIAVSFARLEGLAALIFLVVILLLTLRIVRNLGIAGGARGEAESAAEGKAP